MGWLKVIAVILLSFVPVIGQILWAYYIIKIGWKYIEMCIKVDFWTIYLLVSVFTQLPIYVLIIRPGIAGAHLFERLLGGIHEGVEVLHHQPKSAGALMAILSVIVFSFYPLSIQNLSAAVLAENMANFGIIIFIASFISILGAALYSHFTSKNLKTGSGNQKSRALDPMYTGAQGAKNAVGQGVRGMQEASEQAEEVSELTQQARSKKKKKPWIPKNMKKAAMNLKGSIPFMSSKTAARKTGTKAAKAKRANKAQKTGKAAKAGKAGAKLGTAGAAIGGWELVVLIAAALLAALVMFIIQFVVVMVFAGAVFYAYLPIITGIFGDIFGFSADYANFGGQLLAPYIPNVDLQPVALMVQGPIAKAQCFFEGPQCISEWQMNNTQRPGSEEAGQTYDLSASGFEIEQGQTIDAAYQPPERSLSVAFALENPMYGLNGIAARNVQYSVLVKDNQGQELCGTDYVDISLYDGGTIEETTIPPGDSYAAGASIRNTEIENELTMLKCQLLQPGQAELNREAELRYKYEYSSQSNLRIRAMSYQNYADRDLDRDYRKSETADTPVKSFVNVYAPVLFDESRDGERTARPFEAQIGLETDDLDVRYRVQPDTVRFTPSRATEEVGNCEDFEPVSGSSDGFTTYKLSESAQDQIERETYDSGNWYTSARSPSVMECTMKLSNPDQISSSGETLIMDVSANYTVIKDGTTDNFQTWNTLCSGRNCPLLVTQQSVDGLDEDLQNGFLTTCDPSKRATAVGGCDVRSSGIDDDGNIDRDAWIEPDFTGDDGDLINYEKVEEGETAYNWNQFVEENNDQFSGVALLQKTGGKPAIGLDKNDFNRIDTFDNDGGHDDDTPSSALYITETNEGLDTEFVELDARRVCADNQNGNTDAAMNRFGEIWLERYYGDQLLYLKPTEIVEDCSPSQGTIQEIIDSLDGEDAQDRYENAMGTCRDNNGVLTVYQDAYQCYY